MKTLIFELICFLPFVFSLSSTKQLLIHDLRKDFLEVEDEAWNFFLSNNGDSSVDPWVTIVRKVYDFDRKIEQVCK